MGHPAPKIAAIESAASDIEATLGDMLVSTTDAHGELSFLVERARIADALVALRDAHEYQQLVEIAGVDYPERAERFEVCYHLLSLTRNHRIRVKVQTDETAPVPTVTHIWPVAGWLEREVYDMYGVLFSGNPDLRRILTDYGFRGHPFRKDFPLTGYVEMRYSEEHGRVVYEPVKLAQDFRTFDFMSPWEGADYVLPGDEKAEETPPEVKPAGKAAKAEPGSSTPKTTEKKSDTGAGEPTDKEAHKTKSEGSPAQEESGEDTASPKKKGTAKKTTKPRKKTTGKDGGKA